MKTATNITTKILMYTLVCVSVIFGILATPINIPAITWSIVSGVWMSVAWTYEELYVQLYNFITTEQKSPSE